MSAPSLSNVFSDVYITGNCTVKGTISSLAGSITSQWTTSGSIIYYTTGNVGIGTASPQNSLTVFNSGVSISNVSSGTTLTAAYSAFVNTVDSRRAFVGMDGTGLFAMSTGALALGTDNTPIIFAPSYGSGEKMRILTTGYVGIGTTNPGSLLTVSGGGSFGSGYNAFTAPTGGLIVQGNVGIGTTNPGVNALQVSGNVVTSGFTSNATNTVFNFDTLTVPFVNATQIIASTNIGIGTTNPSTLLNLANPAASNVSMTFTSNDGTLGDSPSYWDSARIIAGWDGSDTAWNKGFFRVQTHSTNTTAFTDDFTIKGGLVGIGTTNPGALFQVNAAVINPTVPTVHIGDNANDYGATYGMVHLVRNATPGDTKAHLSMIRNGNTGFNFGYYNNTNTFGMWRALQTTASTPTISISNSSDFVGIGTTNPTAVFHVWSSTTELMTITATTGSTAGGTTGRGVGCAHAGIYFDRGWSDNPSITVCNTSGTGSAAAQQGTLRIHGTNATYASYPAAGGSDFSVNVVADGTITGTSDRRSKSNITSISNALDLISKMDGKRYQRINSAGMVQTHLSENGYKFGFLAQDLEEEGISELYNYYPEADDKTENYNISYAVDYGSVTAILVNAVKEQQGHISSLEARLAALEAK